MGVCALSEAARSYVRGLEVAVGGGTAECGGGSSSSSSSSGHSARPAILLPTLDEIEEEDATRARTLLTTRAKEVVRPAVPPTDEERMDGLASQPAPHTGPFHRRIDVRYFPSNSYWVCDSLPDDL